MKMDIKEILAPVMQLVADVNQKNPYYTLGIFLVLVFLADYFLVMQFQLKTLSQLNPKVRILSDEVKSTREDVARISEYQNQTRGLDGTLKDLNVKIRSREEMPLIIDSVTRMARANGVRIEQLMPNASLTVSIFQDTSREYFLVPLVLEARGGYHHFGQFLNQLEREEIFISIQDFSIEANPSDATHHAIKVTLKVVVFEAKAR